MLTTFQCKLAITSRDGVKHVVRTYLSAVINVARIVTFREDP
jgi:hypothetical protein